MKKFFLISLMALTCGVMANAERVSLSVNGLGVSLADNMQFGLQAPASFGLGTLNINVVVDDPLLVEGCSKNVSLQTGLNGSIDLTDKLDNVFGFGGASMVVSVKADGASQAFLYNFAPSANGIVATPTDAAAAAWALALSQTSKVANNGDSYLKIAGGSYLQMGGKKLQFTEIEMMKGNWGMESLRADLNAAASVLPANDNANVLFIAQGSEFAVGGHRVIADANVTMTLENGAAFGGDLQALKTAMGVSAEEVIKKFIDLANDFIGYIDGAENYLTINIGDQALQPDDAQIPEEGEAVVLRSGLKAGCLYTICLPYGVENLAGADFYELLGKNSDGNIMLAGVDALAAGYPYVFQAKAEAVSGKATDEYEDEAQNNNGLYGTFVNMKVPAEDNYMFSDYSYNPCGDNSYLAANRAYIHMPEVPVANAAPGRRLLIIGANNAPTAIENVAVENVEGAKKMMIDGQLIIVRDGVMYNAQGAVVK